MPFLPQQGMPLAETLAQFEQYIKFDNKVLPVSISHVEPDKPRNGYIVYADGTDWDPGSGEGFYGYEGGAWVKL